MPQSNFRPTLNNPNVLLKNVQTRLQGQPIQQQRIALNEEQKKLIKRIEFLKNNEKNP